MRGAITPVGVVTPVGVLTPVSGSAGASGAASAPLRLTAPPPRPPEATPTPPAPPPSARSQPPAVRTTGESPPAATVAPQSDPAPSAPTPTPGRLTRLYGPTGWVHVERVPEVIDAVPYEYPARAREAGVQGTVHLEALVGASGSVYDVRVIRSIPMLDAAAKAALKQWKFKPATLGAKPVAVWFEVPIQFTLP